jgi:hypothetical protein
MRVLIIVTVLTVLLAPALAFAKAEPRVTTNRQVCRRMTRQIDHYEGTVLKLAKDRGNKLWENATNDQIDRLKNQRADKCPEWRKQRDAFIRAREEAEKMRQLMVLAGKAAIKYFTGGFY